MQRAQPWRDPKPYAPAQRLHVDVHTNAPEGSSLANDVREGLSQAPKSLPPKYFYDDVGSMLFDRICATPEYYPTRTEAALLETVSGAIIERVRPTEIVELGSGAARKTRALLDAAEQTDNLCRFVPFDVSESMLRQSSETLLRHYSWLSVHGVVGDYERHLHLVPSGKRRLIVFLGGTVGNFAPEDAVRFLAQVRSTMNEHDYLLLGTDLVKDHAVLTAAYNDAQGITAEFNRNVLRVINRELDADFDVDRFEHLAFFNERLRQIEMHLCARHGHCAHIGALDMTVPFAAGESIHTEVSRKFTLETVSSLLADARLELVDWYTPPNGYFGLSLSRVRRPR